VNASDINEGDKILVNGATSAVFLGAEDDMVLYGYVDYHDAQAGVAHQSCVELRDA
jgi:hypothetical protein